MQPCQEMKIERHIARSNVGGGGGFRVSRLCGSRFDLITVGARARVNPYLAESHGDLGKMEGRDARRSVYVRKKSEYGSESERVEELLCVYTEIVKKGVEVVDWKSF